MSKEDTAQKDTPSIKKEAKNEEVDESGLRKVWDFLGRLFNRGR